MHNTRTQTRYPNFLVKPDPNPTRSQKALLVKPWWGDVACREEREERRHRALSVSLIVHQVEDDNWGGHKMLNEWMLRYCWSPSRYISQFSIQNISMTNLITYNLQSLFDKKWDTSGNQYQFRTKSFTQNLSLPQEIIGIEWIFQYRKDSSNRSLKARFLN